MSTRLTYHASFQAREFPDELKDKLQNYQSCESNNCNYLCYSVRLSPIAGDSIIQGYIQWTVPTSFQPLEEDWKAKFYICELSSAEIRSKCQSEGVFFSYGERYGTRRTQSTSQIESIYGRDKWSEARSNAEKGNFSNIPSDILIKYLLNLTRIYEKFKSAPYDLEKHQNLWIWGKSGVGKSLFARELSKYLNKNFYPKSRDKYWLCYKDEEVIIIDDIYRSDGEDLGSELKSWADVYPFIASTKTGGRLIRPKHIIVCSGYSLDEVFGFDENICLALNRRFRVWNMTADEGQNFVPADKRLEKIRNLAGIWNDVDENREIMVAGQDRGNEEGPGGFMELDQRFERSEGIVREQDESAGFRLPSKREVGMEEIGANDLGLGISKVKKRE